MEYAASSTDDELGALSGQLQIAGLNTGTVLMAVNRAPYPVLVVLHGGRDELSSSRISTNGPVDSTLRTVSDLKGQMLALTDVNSNSGFECPSCAEAGSWSGTR